MKLTKKGRIASFLLVITFLVAAFFLPNVLALTTVNVQDGTVADWKYVSGLNDNYLDVNGAGPNDLIKCYVTSDANYIYARWDVIMTGNKNQVTSAAYSLTLTSIPATGTTRPNVEVRAYVGFDAKGAVSTVALANASKTIQLPLTNAEQVGILSAKTCVSIEAKFAFSDFNNNAMTVNPLSSASLFPLWFEALASPSFNSNIKDICPEAGYLNYDAATSSWTAVGTGPLGSINGTTNSPKVVPGATVYYSLVIKNIGDSTGNPNLLFNSVQWTLPASFTYITGSTSGGLTTANPSGTTGTLTWTVSGSLAPGATTTIFFRATAAGTAGTYPSNIIMTATTPAETYDLGDVATVEVNSTYVPPAAPINLAASGTTYTSTHLTWNAVSGAVSYVIYDDGIEIMSGVTNNNTDVTGLAIGSTHHYTVRAVNSSGVYSDESNIATVVTNSTFYVNFNANGGSGTMAQQGITYTTSAALNTNTLTKTGYTFTGWNTAANGSGVAYANNATFGPMGAADVTLYAQWSIATFNVTFNANGGSGTISPQSFTFGSSANLSANTFTRTGYTFAGWNTAANGSGTAYAGGASYTMNTEGATLYAQWTANNYNVTFNANGGTGTMNPQSIAYGSSAALNANTFTRTGYSLTGWNTAANGSGTAYAPGASFTMNTTGATLYAQWSINSYNLTFNANGGTGGSGPVSTQYGAPISAPAVAKTGYTLSSWSPAVPATMPAADSTYTAQWTANTYTIAFNGNGATGGSTASSSNTYDSSKTLTANGFTKTGYTFAGWATSAGGAVAYTDGQSVSNLTATQGATVTLYAKWAANTYTITYNGNTSTSGSTANSTHTFDVSSNLTANGFVKTGNTFLGWSTNSGATSPSYTNSQSVQNLTAVPNDVITFYAVWSVNSYTMTFDANGGTGGTSTLLAYGSTLTPPVVTKTGHTFASWSPSVPSTVPATNATYTAQWSVNSYNLTFNANGGTGGTGPVSTQYGAAISAPAVAKTGYTLSSWSPAVPATMPAADSTYTAQWAANTYTIAYDGNGSTGGSTASSSNTYDSSKALTLNGFTKTGYSFAGWATSAGGPVVYSDGQSVTNLSSTNGATVNLYAKWTVNSYNVSFNANGGTGGTSGYLTYGSALTPPEVTRTGYTFTGWSPSVPATVGAGDVTYTAQWSVNSYDITFDANGGTGGTSTSMVYGSALTPPVVTKTGYTLTGWSPSIPSTVGAGNATYTAQWSINSYNLTFDANGGTGGSGPVSTQFGAAISAPEVAKTGYTLSAWSPAVPATMPAADSIYTAQWTPNTYTIAYNGNGATGGTTASSSNTFDSSNTLTPNGFSKTGYTFAGWSTSAGGPVVYNDSQSVSNLSSVNGATVTLYAKWNASSYTVTFDANGGTGGTSVSVNYGDTLAPPAVAKAGYTLAGWSPALPATAGAGDVTYTAQWNPNTYTVTFDPQGGSVSPETSTVAYNSTYGEGTGGLPVPTKTGYSFEGWYTGTAGTGTEITEDTIVALSGDQTLYANWIMINVPVIGVTLDKSTATVYQFETLKLNETVTPADATDKTVTWSSSNESVATVDSNGLVTAVAPGTAVITVTTNDGGKTATCDFTVLKPTVTVTIEDGKLNINIHGWKSNYSYQIWTYQTVTSDIFLNVSADVKADQWILSGKYTLGASAIQEPDGSISFQIDLPAATPDGNYAVSIKVQDENGNFMGELNDTYTPEQIGYVTISKIYIDGEKTYSNETKEIKAGATVAMKIMASSANSYSITCNGEVLFPEQSGNEFTWNIASMQPGSYKLVFTASNTSSGSSFQKTVVFKLYSRAAGNYGIIDSMPVTGDSVTRLITMNPQMINGDYFYYTIGEPGRAPQIVSQMLPIQTSYTQQLSAKRIGFYQVRGYIARTNADSWDDGIISTIVFPRTGGTASMELFKDGVKINSFGTYTSEKGVLMNYSAVANIGNLPADQIQYSFWRYDATGFVLVKDWSSSNSLDWTPARVGNYTLQVRAKGVDAGSYELIQSISVNVSSDEIAQGVTINTNDTYLNENATARIPIVITADAACSSGEPLLYKFYANDKNLGTYLLQEFSPLQSCEWTPRKPGIYTISVLVKNENSFGKYDAMKSFDVTVK